MDFPVFPLFLFFLFYQLSYQEKVILRKEILQSLTSTSEPPRRRHSPYFQLGAQHCLPPFTYKASSTFYMSVNGVWSFLPAFAFTLFFLEGFLLDFYSFCLLWVSPFPSLSCPGFTFLPLLVFSFLILCLILGDAVSSQGCFSQLYLGHVPEHHRDSACTWQPLLQNVSSR